MNHAEAENTLLSWWLDELDETEAAEVEEHLFECDECTARLREGGKISTVVTPAFVERLSADGFRLREYAPEPGGAVYCTMAPHDDFVISHLRAPLEGVRQVDIEIDAEGGTHRVPHVPFDPAAGEVTVIPPPALLHSLGFATQRMRLFAVTPAGQRLLGEYTFNHEPWESRPQR